jgi:ATP-dependent Clp protease ATP-binding subunit ClpX
MFELPSLEGVDEVILNKEVINGKTKPLLIYSKTQSTKKEEKIAN